jgi:large-conductance mechanosensitive channel
MALKKLLIVEKRYTIFRLSLSATLIIVPIKRSATYSVDSIIMNETAKIMLGRAHIQQTTKWAILIRFFSSLQLLFVFFLITVIIFIAIIMIINMRRRMKIKQLAN